MELPLDPRARGDRAATDPVAPDQERATPLHPTSDNGPGPAAPPQTFVVVEGGNGLNCIEGVIVGGTLDADGAWDLDGLFTLRTEDGDLFRVQGWACITEVQ